MMDELIKNFIVTAPMVALLAFQLQRVYTDWQEERKAASNERMLMIAKLEDIHDQLFNLNTKFNIAADRGLITRKPREP